MKKLYFTMILLATVSLAAKDDIINTNNVIGGKGGRYVMGALFSDSKFIFVIDTKEGRAWKLSSTKENTLTLNPVLYSSFDGYLRLKPEDQKATLLIETLLKQKKNELDKHLNQIKLKKKYEMLKKKAEDNKKRKIADKTDNSEKKE